VWTGEVMSPPCHYEDMMAVYPSSYNWNREPSAGRDITAHKTTKTFTIWLLDGALNGRGSVLTVEPYHPLPHDVRNPCFRMPTRSDSARVDGKNLRKSSTTR